MSDYSFILTPRCRECGAHYGWDKVVPHKPGCSRAMGSSGVLSVDCEWPDDKARRAALLEAIDVIDFHIGILRLGVRDDDDDVTRDRKFARIRTALYLSDQVRDQIDDPANFNTKENEMAIYKVQFQGETRLVKASTIAGARNHILAPLVPEIQMLDAEGVAEAMGSGMKVETAGEQPDPVKPDANDAGDAK